MHLPALDQSHGTSVLAAPHENIVQQGAEQNADENDRSPVKARGRNGVDLGPEAPEESPERVRDSGGVDRDAELAEGELGGGQGLWVTDAAPEEAADAEAVALQQGNGEEGGYGVEGDGTADVDEREADADDGGHDAGVCGDVALRVDLGNPGGEGEALVAGEGEEVAGHGSEIGDVGADEEEDDDDEDHGHPGRGHGLAEDVDCWVEGGVHESDADVGDVVAYGKDGREDQAEIDEVNRHHGFGNGAGGVFDFFGHVCGLDGRLTFGY